MGRAVVADLRAAGREVMPYDLTESNDLLDLQTLRRATRGCDAIVNSAARREDGPT